MINIIPTPGKFHRINDDEFEEFVVAQQMTCLVYCYSSHAGQSPIIEAMVERAIEQYPTLVFFNINIDECPVTTQRFALNRRQQTLLFFRKCQVVDWHYGTIPKRLFHTKLDALQED